MVLTNQLIYLVNVKIMRKIFFKLCVLLKKSELYLLTSLPQLRNSSIKTIELTALEGKIVVNSKEWKGHSRSVTNFRCFIHIGQISWLLLLKENPNAVTHQYEMFPSFFFFPVLFIFFSWVRQFYCTLCTAKHTCNMYACTTWLLEWLVTGHY